MGEWEWDSWNLENGNGTGGGYLGVEKEVVRFDISVDEVECVN